MSDVRSRFEAKYIPEPNSGCWIWIASVRDTGYGQMNVSGYPEKAHRLSWQLAFGDIPARALVLHKCDNRLCVNPDHLYLGTHKDNTRDILERGVHNCWRLREYYSPAVQKTVQKKIIAAVAARRRNDVEAKREHKNAKLSLDQVKEIRAMVGSHKIIAERFSVNPSTISRIKNNKRWGDYFAYSR